MCPHYSATPLLSKNDCKCFGLEAPVLRGYAGVYRRRGPFPTCLTIQVPVLGMDRGWQRHYIHIHACRVTMINPAEIRSGCLIKGLHLHASRSCTARCNGVILLSNTCAL